MDDDFFQRWQSGQPPFDGLTVHPPEGISLTVVLKVLCKAVWYLEEARPDAHLFRIKDWFEHDGWVNEAKASSWEELHEILASEDSLYNARAGDDYVRLGFFPEERDFYLRFYVQEDDKPTERWADWDFTGPETMASAVAAVARSVEPTAVVVEHAKGYFERHELHPLG